MIRENDSQIFSLYTGIQLKVTNFRVWCVYNLDLVNIISLIEKEGSTKGEEDKENERRGVKKDNRKVR